MSIKLNEQKTGDIYIKEHFIEKIYLGDNLAYTKCFGFPVSIGDYEYTLDSDGNLILTKYIGSKPRKVNPNIGIEIDNDYEYTMDSNGRLILTKYIGTALEKTTPNV